MSADQIAEALRLHNHPRSARAPAPSRGKSRGGARCSWTNNCGGGHSDDSQSTAGWISGGGDKSPRKA
eukprot:gene20922-30866_t